MITRVTLIIVFLAMQSKNMGYLIVDEEYKVYAETLCEEFGLQYPPNNHEDATKRWLRWDRFRFVIIITSTCT